MFVEDYRSKESVYKSNRKKVYRKTKIMEQKEHNSYLRARDDLAESVRAGFVSLQIGASSEVWMLRQLCGFKKFEPIVITWRMIEQCDYDLSGYRIYNLDFEMEPQEGPGRWGVRFMNLFSGNFFGSVGAEKRRIKEVLVKEDVDVVLCQFGWTGMRVLPAAKELGLKVVLHCHGRDVGSCMSNKWYRYSFKKCLGDFASIIVVGSHQKRLLESMGVDGDKVFLLPCGVPVDEFAYRGARRSDVKVFISVGRCEKEKGLEYSLRAFGEAVKQLGELRYVIVGDGSERCRLEKLAKELGIREKVEFTGGVSGEKVREYMRGADVFLQHSVETDSGQCEGFGVSIAEASASGLPVVVTDCGGITDQVIDGVTGFVVQQRDVDTMAERMIQLYEDSELREKMGNAGRVRMEEYFDTEKQISKLEDVILDAVRQKSKDY